MVGPVTIKTDCLAQLSGTYTIDANGTGANNFATLDSATQFLAGCGISGPVTFNVAAGTYTGSINLATVIGGSSTNTVTINGPATGVAKINASAGQTAATFDGTSYVTLNNLTLSNQMGHVIWMVNGAEYITVNGCKILGDTVGTSSTTGTPIAISALSTSPTSYGLNANHITITNNVVKGGYYGIVVNGASAGSKVQDFTITGNDVSLQYFYNIRTYYAEDLTINDNNCHDTRSTGGYGLMVYYSNDFEIVGNNLPSKSYGLYLYYANVYNSSGATGYTPTTQSLVANNMVKGSTYGAYMYSPRYVDFYYNTFAGTTYGAYIGNHHGSRSTNDEPEHEEQHLHGVYELLGVRPNCAVECAWLGLQLVLHGWRESGLLWLGLHHVERLADSQFSHQCQLGEFTSDLHGCGRPCTWSRVPITWVRLFIRHHHGHRR